jgi:hypothetical protein
VPIAGAPPDAPFEAGVLAVLAVHAETAANIRAGAPTARQSFRVMLTPPAAA